MKEINSIIESYDQSDPALKLALATVVYVDGSSYRRIGARMLIYENGQWLGGISGGCLEGDTLRKAKLAMIENEAQIVTYDTREEDSQEIGIGLGCNGLIDVLIYPIDRNDENNPVEKLKRITQNRKEHFLITPIINADEIDSVGKIYFKGDKDLLQSFKSSVNADEILAEIENSIQSVKYKRKSKVLNVHSKRILIEYLNPAPRIFIYGGQYDVLPLLQIVKVLGWESILISNTQKLKKELKDLPDQLIDLEQKTNFGEVDPFSIAVLMAHDFKKDKEHLKQLIELGKFGYIGLLGPRKRCNKMLKELTSEGLIIPEEVLQKIYSPIGLDTGATSPEEIAISIVAEIRSYFSKRDGRSLRFREGPIHEREGC